MPTDPSTPVTGDDALTPAAAAAAGYYGSSLETAAERAKYLLTSGTDKRGKAEQNTTTAPAKHFRR